MDCTKETKSKSVETFLPPLSPNNSQVGSSSSRQSSRLHSSSTVRSSLSSRHSASSAQSGNSALEEKRKEKKSADSINSETLAIAIELSKLKERREIDERETLARILDNSNHFGSGLRRPSSMATPRPQIGKTLSPRIAKTPPSTRAYTGPGAHFLDWYIPKHLTGSRAFQRSPSASIQNKIICSPLHRPEKQEWTDKLIDPKASGLRIPTAVPPRIIDYPCTWQNNFKEELKKYQTKVDLQNSKKSELKSLAPTKAKTEFPIDTSDNKLNGSMFVKTQVAPMPWFIVHPDWRNEPKITWNDLES